MGSGFWVGKRVLVTGGTGFIGSHVAEFLSAEGAHVRVTAREKAGAEAKRNLSGRGGKIEVVQADLRKPRDCAKACRGMDAAFHLAAVVGGVEFNMAHPATILTENTAMTSNVLEAIRGSGAERAVIASSAIVYPDGAEGAIGEEMGFAGEPDRAKFGYAWSKRFDELLARAYHEEHGMRIGIARPFNVYGPRDVFDAEKAHVIPSIIRQALENGRVRVLGSGEQERSFVFVKDVAEGMALIAERRAVPDPINLGSAEGVKVIELVGKVSAIIGREIGVEHNDSVRLGSARRLCDTSKAQSLLGFTARTGIDEGLRQTIEWFGKKHGRKPE